MHYGNRHAGSVVPLICALGRAVIGSGDRFCLVSTAVAEETWTQRVRDAGIELYLADDVQSAARLVRSLNPDVAHCHFDTQTATSLALLRRPTRIFWHVHTPRPPSARTLGAFLKSYIKYRLVGVRTERFLTVSEDLARELKSWGAPPSKVGVLYLGIDTEWFRPPTAEERQSARHLHHIGEDERVVVFFGWDAERKGIDFLADALQRTSGLTVLAVGVSQDWQRKLAATPNRLIPVQPSNDVRSLYWAADKIAMPSRREGIPLTLLEALGCGLPAATSNIPSFLEVAPDVPGIVALDPSRSDDFANQLSITSHVRNASHPAVAAKWSVDSFVRSCLSLYQEPDSEREVHFKVEPCE